MARRDIFWAHPIAITTLTALLLTGCASNRPGYSGFERPGQVQAQLSFEQLTERYKANPKDRNIAISYSSGLRSRGQAEQAIAALQPALAAHPKDGQLVIAYAKALTAAGQFENSLSVIDRVINPAAPDWNALLVKGATLDQMGRNGQARQIYAQASALAPTEASIEANLGLSYAMTNELPKAEQHLRRSVQMRGANSQTRQNLALVVGLQGKFDESRKLYAAELPPEKVEANIAYIRALLTQQNRWDLLKG